MLYFREEQLKKLHSFHRSSKKAFAVYGRRRTGKTALLLQYIKDSRNKNVIYYQCSGYDYHTCLQDFIAVLLQHTRDDGILRSLTSFKDVFTYFGKINSDGYLMVIDEFPFLCKKNEDAALEFQWIIDHGLGTSKLILLGSNMSFMKRQINDMEAPLYGRFDEIIEVRPFSFHEVLQLFPSFEEAVDVYAQTGGVAQYVMYYKAYDRVSTAADALYFERDGRLTQEAGNLLMQELRDVTTYTSILRALSGGEKNSGQIVAKTGMDQRGIFSYLKKLTELGVISEVHNPLSGKKRDNRYEISDLLFRFHYTFIEPNLSMITSLEKNAKKHILDNRYAEYLGTIYEEIIRENIFNYAEQGVIPFMPVTVGKWWGQIMHDGTWTESEADLVAYNNHHIVIGECKYKNKKTGIKEYALLREKASFIPVKGRKVHLLMASKSGFTEELKKEDVILIDRV